MTYKKYTKGPPEERFWPLVDRRGDDECWPWLGGKGGGTPRGRFWMDGRLQYSHRVAWTFLRGPIPEGMVIDHLCKNGDCNNPAHMRVTTQRVNSTDNSTSPLARNAQKTRCKQGHELTADNIAIVARGGMKKADGNRVGRTRCRVCLTCFPWYWKHAVVPRQKPAPGYTKQSPYAQNKRRKASLTKGRES